MGYGAAYQCGFGYNKNDICVTSDAEQMINIK